MFGIFRYIFSNMVFAGHLVSMEHLFRKSEISSQAVFGFFLLSGYFITLVLQEKYHFSIRGVKNYLISRFSRIYPTYYVVLLLSILALIVFPPDFFSNMWGEMKLPSSASEWWPNIFIFGIVGLNNPAYIRIVPSAWTLDVTLVSLFGSKPLGFSRTFQDDIL